MERGLRAREDERGEVKRGWRREEGESKRERRRKEVLTISHSSLDGGDLLLQLGHELVIDRVLNDDPGTGDATGTSD